MVLPRWQATIQDEAGNVVPNAEITVRREIDGQPLAPLYSDRDGTTPIGNPFNADGDGFAFFFANSGAYRITASDGSNLIDWRYVPVGLAAETGAAFAGNPYTFDDSTTDSDPGPGVFRFDNGTLASVTGIYIDEIDSDGVDLSAALDRLDDFGGPTDRGTVLIRNTDGTVVFLGQITGSVVDGTGYRGLTITHLASSGAFVAGSVYDVIFNPRGADGLFNGSEATVVAALDDQVALKDASDDDEPKFADVSTLGIGRQTIWIPASAMRDSPASGDPSSGEISVSATGIDILSFDPSSLEDSTFSVAMPNGWDAGDISYQVYWAHGATATNFDVVWQMFGRAYGNDEQIDGASYTSLGTVVDTGGSTLDLYVSDESTPETVSGAAKNDLLNFIIRRVGTDGADTLAVDAQLIGVKIFYNTDANTDD